MRRLHRSEDGAAAVEMAFASLFILLPLFFGVIDLGRAFSYSIAMSDVAQQTAMYAAFQGATAESDLQDHALAISSFPLAAEDVSAACEVRGGSELDGSAVRIAIDYDFDGLFLPTIQLSRSSYAEGIATCDWSTP